MEKNSYITTQKELENICNRMQEAGCMGIDLEFIPENTYYPQLALVQVAVEDDCYLLDPLGDMDLTPLESVLQSEQVITVVHAGAQDMAIFFQQTNKPPKMVFDTQLAASFLGMGHQVAYGTMVQQLFGVSLNKGQSYSDWMRRPLRPQQIKYALEDVVYLIAAYEKITRSLEEKGRLSWVAEELQVYESPSFYLQHSKHPEKRVKKSRKLKPREQIVLEALAAWREETAQQKNLPRKKILTDVDLVDLARRAPQTEGELFSMRSAGYTVKRYAKALLQVIQRAKSAPLPTEPSQPSRALNSDQKQLIDFLQFCLKVFCQQEDISSSYVSTKAELEDLVQDYFSESFDPAQHRLLRGWRLKAVGKQVLDCLEGRVGVTFSSAHGKLIFIDIRQ